MASVNQLIDAAESCGFHRTSCIHDPTGERHIVLDHPQPFEDVSALQDFNRVHIDVTGPQTVVYIVGDQIGGEEYRSTLRGAIDFVKAVSEHT